MYVGILEKNFFFTFHTNGKVISCTRIHICWLSGDVTSKCEDILANQKPAEKQKCLKNNNKGAFIETHVRSQARKVQTSTILLLSAVYLLLHQQINGK